MAVHIFASYGTDTYLVEADSEAEAKGHMWDKDSSETVEYVGTVEDILDGENVAKPTPF